jgi:hypothetical protein
VGQHGAEGGFRPGSGVERADDHCECDIRHFWRETVVDMIL